MLFLSFFPLVKTQIILGLLEKHISQKAFVFVRSLLILIVYRVPVLLAFSPSLMTYIVATGFKYLTLNWDLLSCLNMGVQLSWEPGVGSWGRRTLLLRSQPCSFWEDWVWEWDACPQNEPVDFWTRPPLSSPMFLCNWLINTHDSSSFCDCQLWMNKSHNETRRVTFVADMVGG